MPWSGNRASQLIQLLDDAISSGNDDLADTIRSDLYREFGIKKAYGGRVGALFGGWFGGGDEEAEEVRDPEYEGWKEMYEKNPDIGMLHENAAEYLEKYKMELNNNANGGIIGLARGGEPTHEMDYGKRMV